jgi:type IV secretion system protein VirD4
VWSAVEDVTLRIGGPGTGKSGSLICHGMDAPGALVTTSTKLDLAEAVHSARCDRAVHIMNIGGLGGVPSTVRWRVLDGCEDYGTAIRRAADLLPGAVRKAADDIDWSEKGREVLALLLHAAAVDGRRMRDVTPWMNADSGDKARPGQKLAAEQVTTVLASVDDGGPERADRWRQHLAEPEKTRGSVIATMRPALAWLGDDTARQIGDAERGTTTFDVRTLVRCSETLHIVGKDGGSTLAPLIAAIVSEITHQALHLAAEMPKGRLDPPLTVLLDEAHLVCPVPLPEWTAHFRSRNISLHVSVQSIASLRARWGDNGASQILGNVGTLVVFGGGKDEGDLKALSTLTGEHRQKILDADGRKDLEHHEHRWKPVLSPAEISALPEFQCLVLRRGIHAVIGWAPMAWHRKGWAPMPLVPPRTPRTADGAESDAREWWTVREVDEDVDVEPPFGWKVES